MAGEKGRGNNVAAEHREKKEKADKAIRQLEKHVKRNQDGTFSLSAQSAAEAGVHPEAFEQLRQSLEAGNEYIRSGKVKGKDVRDKTDEGGA